MKIGGIVIKSDSKPKRLKKRIFLLIEILAIFQLGMVVLGIYLSGTMKQLEDNARNILNSTSSSENIRIKKQMEKLSDLKIYTNMLKKEMTSLKEEKDISTMSMINNKKYLKKFFKNTSPIILKILNDTDATGSFIILNNGEEVGNKSCIYLRSYNSKNNVIDNSNIIAKAASEDIISDMNIIKSKNCSDKIYIDKDDKYYWKPIQAANRYKNISIDDLGYWSPTFKLNPNDISIITYTVPLLDENNLPYGILGVEISTSYLQSFFDSNVLNKDGESSLYIGISKGRDIYETQLISSTYYKQIFSIGTNVKVYNNKKDDISSIYRDDKLDLSNNLISLLDLNLYSDKSPFKTDKWITGIILTRTEFYSSVNRLKRSLMITIGFALLFGFIGTMISTDLLLKPIDKLMNKLRKTETLENVTLGRTNIIEIDELAQGIERLSKDVFDNASRVSNVIEMSDMKLGVLEYNENRDIVFCTKKLREMVEFYDNTIKGDYIPKDVFLRELYKFRNKTKKETSETNIYSYTTLDGKKRYIKIIESDSNKGRRLFIFLDVTSEILEKQKIIYDRDHDTLTNLLNRNAFEICMKNLIKNGKYKTGVLVIWDLDDLKHINDNYGHDVGDKYIFKFGLMLEEFKKEGALVSRMAGDEFILFYPGKIEEEEICKRIEEYHKKCLNTNLDLPGDKMAKMSVSAGIAILGKDANEYEKLLKYADFAMYEVKNTTKGRINRFNKENYIKDYVLTHGAEELNLVLEKENINYAFQPIVDMKTKEIFAYEALMRPKSELLKSPEDLIRVADAQLKLNKIETITWFKSLETFFNKMEKSKNIRVFINSLPNQCLDDEQFEKLQLKYGDRLKQVVMEITENAKINSDYQKTKSKWCDKCGIQVALDDYGAGYSNNEILISRTFDYVKLDRSLIKDIDKKTSIQILTKGIIGFCHKNGIKVIGEGIETKEEFDVLLDLKVDYGQGYFLARPSFELIKSI